MTVKYYAILTNQGAARLANATMLGSKLNLTQMAVGDANGVLPTPDPAQTKLINQKRIAPLNLLSVDPNNQSQIIAEQIIPENEGGFWIREIGLYDDEGVLIAVANCPETYKPQLQEGSGRTQTIRMILVVTNTEAITLKIDPSVVLATRKYVDDEVLELRLYVDDQMRNHIAAQDPHTQYAQKHNPTFTGEPKAPTPAAGNNTTRIATTEFVQAAITALINGAPATLDTLKEIAAAINNDPKFSATINNALSGKQPLDETLTHLSGKDVAGLLAYLGLGETINLAKNAVPATRRVNNKPLTGDITLWASDVGALPIAGGQLNGALSIGTDNALGGNSIVLGDNDTGFKQDGDGVLGIYANNARVGYIDNSGLHMSVDVLTNGAVRAGDGKKLSLTSNNNSTMTATFNLWGDANRPTVIELDDDQGWHLYSQRNPDGSIVFTVNGDITANTLRAGGAIYQNNGDIFGSVWGGWLSLWIKNNFVADVQLGAGTSVVTWNNAGSWPNTPGYVVTSVWKDTQGENIDGINYAPLQKRVGNQWYTVQGGTV
ncbi:phage tail protein [Salmonella enterica subsp. enterica serovar 4,[5],12:i:-]|uniref:Phage tail protein n=6 Tax=Salmonella enterica TaxID=28901 RepID=A0A627U3K3_SALET|nr:phage tail protein [Salmonella enterica]EBB6747478.1 phage tail protein [Salmonella enterica subsp. enterica serovar 4,[5],12:i:-]EBN0196005.1 phage tail protein [Salmonella enterica subsp. enterica serovar Infantis]ECA6293432.1 phage tail protein [Salmonella enterica subsp. enterica serovar Agona]ECV2894640.1 phage tail protein [Salmonella enterica subsp. enterica serovar 4:i:-]ECX5636302.1 phage tail protein [Salmonella enterica subsp. enterica serovar Dublin]EDC0309184.1 phage tail prot